MLWVFNILLIHGKFKQFQQVQCMICGLQGVQAYMEKPNFSSFVFSQYAPRRPVTPSIELAYLWHQNARSVHNSNSVTNQIATVRTGRTEVPT